MKDFLILAINPGSTSTKIAVYKNEQPLMEKVLRHPIKEISAFEKISDQFEFRKKFIEEAIVEAGIQVSDLDAVVGRGGLLRPIPGGTYSINEAMVEDLRAGVSGQHAANLGGIIAKQIAQEAGCPSYIVDPGVVDELEEIARISGVPQMPRRSIFHALNQKAIARRAAQEMGKRYDEINLIVAHMGGGVSVGAHRRGRIIDVNNALDGEGAFSPERAGGVPVGDLIKVCFSGKYTMEEVQKMLKGNGGIVAYLGETSALEVEKRIDAGDEEAKLIYEAMAYQVAKEIGAYATVLKGEVDLIALTGGIAYSERMTSWITERVGFIAPVKIYGGEDELSALVLGALRVLRGEELPQEYEV